jgi:hypothetical protein
MHTEVLLSPPNGRVTQIAFSNYSPALPRVPGVTAELAYLSPPSGRPYTYMYEPPADVAKHNCDYKVSSVRIADARAMASPSTLHVQGFELWDAPTSIADFRDEDAIRSRYYAEAAELARCVTGAERAFVFDHAVRQREKGRPALNFGRNGTGNSLGAVGRVHTDYSEASGQRRLELIAAEHEIRPLPRRFAIVNIWRSIRGRIMDTPLAICDARSIAASDLVATDLRYPDRTGEIYLVQESPHHRWSYFSEMDSHEALVFKQYDSQMSGVARFTPHTAFDLPDIQADAPLRASIEIRCLVTYG